MLALGIDPGLTTCGWGVVNEEHGNLSCIAFGALTTKPSETTPDRLFVLAKGLRALFVKFRPRILAVERVFWGANRATAMRVAEAKGVVLLTAAERRIPVVEFTPLEAKKALSLFGRAQKNQIQHAVKQILGMAELPTPPDAADALALAILGAFSAKGKIPLV